MWHCGTSTQYLKVLNPPPSYTSSAENDATKERC